jgi:MFS family permease
MQLGLKANWRQFTLLAVVNGFVGAMVGQERTIVPLIAGESFGIVSRSLILSFLFSFGVVKALSNFLAGGFSDKIGRKKILIVGWLFGLPVPVMIMLAPSWEWIVFANILLGINQGLCWSATVIMKIDLVGPRRRGFAMGLNEFAGYVCVSAAALLTGYLAAKFGELRPVPFYPGMGFASAGLVLSVFFVKETREYVKLEMGVDSRLEVTDSRLPRILDTHSRSVDEASGDGIFSPSVRGQNDDTTLKNLFLYSLRREKNLLSANQAGLVNNLNDAVMWGLAPVFLFAKGLDLEQIALVTAVYPAVWGMLQLITGTLSDRWGRKWLIVTGMWVQALSIILFAVSNNFTVWMLCSFALGLGTAMVYPTLIAAVSDVSAPNWRASAVGIYRLWRDSGYAFGALAAGLISDSFNITIAVAAIGVLTFLSGGFGAVFMKETKQFSFGTRTRQTEFAQRTPSEGTGGAGDLRTREISDIGKIFFGRWRSRGMRAGRRRGRS